MHCEATFDNSAKNLANPDPTQTVRWGDQTWEEMMIGYFDMALVDQDLTKPKERRTDAFLKSAKESKLTLSDDLKTKAGEALSSAEKLNEFGAELRKVVPQLDRICWSSVSEGKVTIERVAQERAIALAIPASNAGRQVDARSSKLADLAKAAKPLRHRKLSEETQIDLKYMAQAFASSLHVPIEREGKPGTINFWSSEADAFPVEAVELLREVATLMK